MRYSLPSLDCRVFLLNNNGNVDVIEFISVEYDVTIFMLAYHIDFLKPSQMLAPTMGVIGVMNDETLRCMPIKPNPGRGEVVQSMPIEYQEMGIVWIGFTVVETAQMIGPCVDMIKTPVH